MLLICFLPPFHCTALGDRPLAVDPVLPIRWQRALATSKASERKHISCSLDGVCLIITLFIHWVQGCHTILLFKLPFASGGASYVALLSIHDTEPLQAITRRPPLFALLFQQPRTHFKSAARFERRLFGLSSGSSIRSATESSAN